MNGANVPAVMRALVACGWFGINAWIGGKALHTLFRTLWPGWTNLLGAAPKACEPEHACTTLRWLMSGHPPTEFIAFLLFWGLNILIVYKGMEVLRKVENLAAPYVLVMTAGLVAWAIWRAHGLGSVMAAEGKFRTLGSFWVIFVPSVTAMIGFWSTLSLNMPDFTRFGRSQREQAIGQVVALPTTMTLFAAMGVIITSASQEIYGEAIWDPVDLVGRFESRLLVAVSMFTVVVATLGVNIAANVVSPANDFANLAPRHISFKTGGLITGIVGILMVPWKLQEDPEGYIYRWLLGYSGGLGSIGGVLIADYWLIRRTRLDIADLYRRDGRYGKDPGGMSVPALVATFAGCALSWIGAVVPALKGMFDYAWFVGALASAGVYTAMMWGKREAAAPEAPPPPAEV